MSAPSDKEAVWCPKGQWWRRVEGSRTSAKSLSGVELCFMTLVCKAVGERRFLRYQS